MTVRKTPGLKPGILSTALLIALLPITSAVCAQEQESSAGATEAATDLEKVVVTGSLIPQTQVETFTPVTIITAEDIQKRGFVNVADALQQASFSTGGVQGSQTSASFTQGAETLSLFGLSASYVKYLIDGRPMANYPALYNGSDTFNNISNIPIDLIERIEILPGGQSSLYGSDAIAGVINVILKKSLEGGVISIRGGTYSEGGGTTFRASVAKGFSAADGRLNALFGLQYEETDPIWGYQRDLTRQYNQNAYNGAPPLASRDFLVFSPFTSYNFLDPANCANVDHLFNGTEGLQQRPGFGDEFYCGSLFTPGYRTLKNGKEAGQFYGHATFDLNDNTELYADAMYSREKISYHVGSNFTWWGTGVEWGYFYDPNLDDLVNLQRAFAPEEMGPGGFANTMSEDDSRAYNLTFGIRGTFGSSDWDYDALVMRTDYRLTENNFVRWADPINDFFVQRVLGPQQGLDPYYDTYPVFTPDYAAFYQPITQAEFDSFTGYAPSHSKTYDNMARVQITNATLFTLPGGDAGLAVALEGGKQGWEYKPHPGLLNGDVWGTTAVAGEGERSRYAVTGEVRMPVWEPLTVSLSARYDAFRVAGQTVDKPTYSLGLEYRPLESLLFRGKYGTAFKAPTLSDQFQGLSGFYSTVVDYYNCQELGFEPAEAEASCPAVFSNRQYFGTQSGNPDLEPITADVWSAGVVFAPLPRMSISVDYHHWDIRNEVNLQRANDLALQENACRRGQLDINSPTCVAAISQITRNGAGAIVEIYQGKVNVSEQQLSAVTANFNYGVEVGNFGDLVFDASYTNNLEHTQVSFPGDPEIDLIANPYWSTDPKTKANASLTWRKGRWSSTAYVNRAGKTPNYRANLTPAGYASPGAGTLQPWITYNLSVSYNPLDDLQLSVLVNNVLNNMPDFDGSYPGTSGAPYNSGNYNPYGRAIYLEARYAFGKE